jgi:hypothetical protein
MANGVCGAPTETSKKNGRAGKGRPRKGTVGLWEDQRVEEGRERKRCRRVYLASALPAPLCAWLVHGWLLGFDVFSFVLGSPLDSPRFVRQQPTAATTAVPAQTRDGARIHKRDRRVRGLCSGADSAPHPAAPHGPLTSSDLFVAVGSSSAPPSSPSTRPSTLATRIHQHTHYSHEQLRRGRSHQTGAGSLALCSQAGRLACPRRAGSRTFPFSARSFRMLMTDWMADD